LKDYNLE